MLQQKLKGILPHITAIALFIVISAIYFFPQIQGLQLRPGDITHHIGMSKEISDFRTDYHSEPLWTNSMFGGMPAYQISTLNSNYVSQLESNLIFRTLSSPLGYMALAMIGFYILLVCFGVNPWISIIGAITFGLSTLNILYLEGGHFTKVHAIALIPPLLGSMLLAYRKDMIKGAILLAFFICLELAANHLQMTYYALFLILPLVVVELYLHIKNKLLIKFGKVSAILMVAVIIGILPTITNLLTTYEYSKYTTRGKSEITVKPKSESYSTTNKEALSSEYIKEYNFGQGEIWSIVIPNIKGGNAEQIGNRKGALKNVDEQLKQTVAQQSSYWGEQSFSGGAFYFGAGMFLLFILGLIFIKDPIKWAFLFVSIIALLLSLKYSSLLDWFIDHFPLFNKFRDTKMMMYLVQIAIPFIGLLFVKDLFTTQIDKKKLSISLIIINGILFIIYLMPTVWFDFLSIQESDYFNNLLQQYQNDPSYSQQISAFLPELENARVNIFKADVLRSLFFIVVISGLIYVTVIGKLKKNYFAIILGLLVLIDIWAVDKRYLNSEKDGSRYKSWVKKVEMFNPIPMSAADNAILTNEIKNNPALGSKINEEVSKITTNYKDKSTNPELEKIKAAFKVLNFSTDYRVLTLDNPFANSSVSYFHKSIGGYHGAKLKKYQELIEFYLNQEYQLLARALQDSTITEERFTGILSGGIPVLNMLNTKYIISNPNYAPITNPYANGNCWFVKNVEMVDSANDEILALGKYNLKETAIINKTDFAEALNIIPDSSASITMESYLPNHLKYKTKANSEQVAVFSEIYYTAGWDAYLDGKKTDYFKADYILRAMKVPAGEHIIEFKFEPKSYLTGEKIAKASSVLLLLLIIGWAGMELFKYFKK